MLSSDHLFRWHAAVSEHRRLRNITPFQADVLLVLGAWIEAGDIEPTDARLAAETGYGVSTCQEARRRACAVGLLAWEAQYHDCVPRRRRANRYWLVMPDAEAELRPDLRRKRQPVGVQRARGESKIPVSAPVDSLDAIRERREALIAAEWASRRASLPVRLTGVSPQNHRGASLEAYHGREP